MNEIHAVVQEEQPKDVRYRLKSIFGGSIGNLVEWYDWYSYSAFALYFSPIFFPNSNPTAQLLDTAGIFAVGFLMRPIGGWLFGTIADKHGRKQSMALSVLIMALWFKNSGHEQYFYFYVTFCILISLVLYTTMKDTKHHSKIEDD